MVIMIREEHIEKGYNNRSRASTIHTYITGALLAKHSIHFVVRLLF